MKASVYPWPWESNTRQHRDKAPTNSAHVFLALTQTKLLVSCHLVNALITQSGLVGGILGARLVGEAFKEIGTAVDQAIGGQADDSWVRIYGMFAKAYREAFVLSTRNRSEGTTRDSFDEGD